MEITISSRTVELTPGLRAVVEEKVGHLDRFLDGLDHAEVHLAAEHNPRIDTPVVCEVWLHGHGARVRATAQAADARAALDAVVDKLQHQLERRRTRRLARDR